MEKAEKIMSVFVSGQMAQRRSDPRRSPLLSTYRRGAACFLSEATPLPRSLNIEIALNYGGEIIHRPLPPRSQVAGMLKKAGSREIGEADFNTIRIHLGLHDIHGFQTTMLRPEPGGAMHLTGEALKRAGLPALCVAPIEERLAYYSREFFDDKYRAVMCGLPKLQRGSFYPLKLGFHNEEPIMSVMGAPGWTFFEDEVEAMMIRLAHDSDRIRYYAI